MEKVALSLGSNLGSRNENIVTAFSNLWNLFVDARLSNIYETAPLYLTAQAEFLNAVIVGYTDISPIRLLKEIQRVEIEMGRNRIGVPKMGPRLIDIDIILFGRQIIKSDNLTVPHPRLEERKFVLIPLLELEPQIGNPQTGEPYWRVLQRLKNQGIYYYTFHHYSMEQELRFSEQKKCQ